MGGELQRVPGSVNPVCDWLAAGGESSWTLCLQKADQGSEKTIPEVVDSPETPGSEPSASLEESLVTFLTPFLGEGEAAGRGQGMEPPSFRGSGQKTKPWSWEGPSLLIHGPQILGVWEVVLKSCRVQGSFWTWWLHGSVTGWVMWRRAGSEEAAGPGRCPTQKPYLSLTMATLVTSWLGLPWAQPRTPRISSDYRTAHSHERGGHPVPDCLPWACLLRLARPQEPEGQTVPRPQISPGTPIGGGPLRTPGNLSLGTQRPGAVPGFFREQVAGLTGTRTS